MVRSYITLLRRVVRGSFASRAALVGILAALCLAGCRTAQPVQVSPARSADAFLSEEDLDFARALARYSFAWLCDTNGTDDSFYHFERAVELDPAADRVAVVVAKKYVAKGRLEDGIRFLEKTLAASPDSLLLCRALSRMYSAADNTEKAFELSRRLIEIDPTHHVGYIDVATHLIAQTNSEAAVEVLASCLDDVAQPAAILRECLQWDETCALLGRYDLAAQWARVVHEYDPTPANSMLLILRHISAEQPEEAYRVWKDTRSLATNVSFHFYVGRHFLGYGEPGKSLVVFRYGERMMPEADSDEARMLDSEYYYFYGAAADSAGKTELARKLMARSIELNGDNHSAKNHLAYSWSEDGIRLDEGLDLVLDALAFEPGNAAYLDTLGWILYKQGKYADALAHINRAVAIYPDAVIVDHLGDVLDALERPSEALRAWEQSFMLDPTDNAVRAKLASHGVDPESLLKEEQEEPPGE